MTILHKVEFETRCVTFCCVGIFGKPVQAIQAVDSLGTTLILWLFCGILYTLGGLIYAEIGTTFPVSGGDASYLLIFYGPLGGTLYQFGANLFMA